MSNNSDPRRSGATERPLEPTPELRPERSKPMAKGYVDPAAGIVFPQRLRRRR